MTATASTLEETLFYKEAGYNKGHACSWKSLELSQLCNPDCNPNHTSFLAARSLASGATTSDQSLGAAATHANASILNASVDISGDLLDTVSFLLCGCYFSALPFTSRL